VGKDKKLKLPKKIAGVKVPKELRKKANKAIRIAENPAARELALMALGAAAAALAENKKVRRSAQDAAASARANAEDAMEEAREQARAAAETAREEAGEAAETVRRETLRLGDVIRAAAIEGARRLLEEMEAARRRACEGEHEGEAADSCGRRRRPNGGDAAEQAD
jgi:hypothetical protein